MTASIDIEHPYRGDLKVVLLSPDAQGVVLHDRGGASGDDLIGTYATEATPELAIFLGKEARGEWTLEVADLEGRDVGMLRSWALELDLEEA